MKNVKFIAGFSIFGFLLSLISGLISHSSPAGVIFLHALIFALVFAFLAVGLQFVFEKVLDIDCQADQSAGTEAVSASGTGSEKHSVDFYVEDEELSDDDNDAQFFVGNNHQMLYEDDVSPENKNPSAEQEGSSLQEEIARQNGDSAGFVPVSFVEKPDTLSGTEAKSMNEIKSNEKKSEMSDGFEASPASDDNEPLDILPDLESISTSGISSVSVSENSEPDADGAFNPSGHSGQEKSADEIAEGQDAAVMAKAISTLLAKDN